MVNYPNKKVIESAKRTLPSAANRGMNFEHAVSSSCEYYLNENVAMILKRPTPIHVVKVDYAHNARITDAYFEKQSTTDYNGVYKGKYIDFECKETKSKTSLTFHNISKHQVEHLQKVMNQDGIAFFMIHFVMLGEVYLLDSKYIVDQYLYGTRKSISYSDVKKYGEPIEQGFIPRLKFIEAINKVYFNEEIKEK